MCFIAVKTTHHTYPLSVERHTCKRKRIAHAQYINYCGHVTCLWLQVGVAQCSRQLQCSKNSHGRGWQHYYSNFEGHWLVSRCWIDTAWVNKLYHIPETFFMLSLVDTFMCWGCGVEIISNDGLSTACCCFPTCSNIEEDVTNLQSFSADMIVEACVRCLRVINSDFQSSTALPEVMSARYRMCSNLANAIQVWLMHYQNICPKEA